MLATMSVRIVRRMAMVGALALMACMGGCVQRELTITTEPPGAIVYLNDVEVGRTPVTRPFVFYGTYDVVVRKEGYETLKTQHLVLAPWWQWVPIDLVAEVLPLTDRQSMAFTLKAQTAEPANPAEMLQRAAELRAKFTTTQPTTIPIAGSGEGQSSK